MHSGHLSLRDPALIRSSVFVEMNLHREFLLSPTFGNTKFSLSSSIVLQMEGAFLVVLQTIELLSMAVVLHTHSDLNAMYMHFVPRVVLSPLAVVLS